MTSEVPGQQGPHFHQVNQARGRVDIGKMYLAAAVAHAVSRGREGERRGDDALAGLHVQGQGA